MKESAFDVLENDAAVTWAFSVYRKEDPGSVSQRCVDSGKLSHKPKLSQKLSDCDIIDGGANHGRSFLHVFL
jgi:hypothetical protein